MILSHHLRKPPGVAKLRRGHPLAYGLEVLLLFDRQGGAYDLVNGKPFPMSSSSIIVPCSDGGYALRGIADSTHVYRGTLFNRGITVFSRFLPPPPAGPSSPQALANLGNIGSIIPFQLYLQNGSLRFLRGSGVSQLEYQTSATVDLGWPASAAVTSNYLVEGARLFLNGNLLSASTVGAGNGAAVTTNGVINIGNAAGGNIFGGDIEIVGIWSRELSNQDLRWLNADPYDLVRPRKLTLEIGALPFGIVVAEANVAASVALVFKEAAAATAQAQIEANIEVARQLEIAAGISAVVNSSSALFRSVGNNASVYSLASNDDDGYVNSGGVITNGVVTATNTSVAFMRFQDVVVPKGGYIRDAFLILNPTSTTNTITNVVVYASNLDYAYIPTSYGDFLLQPRTAVVSIAIPPVTANVPVRLQNLAPAIQNIADRTNLQSPTAVVLFVDSRSTVANIGFTSRDSNPALAAQLFLEYGVYTTLKSNTMTAISTVTANVRLFPIVAADITATTSIGARLAERMTISASATAIATILAGVTPNPVPIAAAITAVASITATMNTLSYSQAHAFAQVTIFGELRVVRQLPISVGFDFTDSDIFRLRVSSVVVDVSA